VTYMQELRIATLAFGTGRPKMALLNEGQIPNVRVVRVALGAGYIPGEGTRRAWRNGPRELICHPNP
jgi:hypothetical protein